MGSIKFSTILLGYFWGVILDSYEALTDKELGEIGA